MKFDEKCKLPAYVKNETIMKVDYDFRVKKIKLTLIYILLVITFGKISAQVTLEWVARYNSQNNGSDYARAMAIDSMGNVYISGTDEDSPPGFVTIKINSSGQIVWARRYSDARGIKPTPKSIAVDLQGNVYVGASDVDYIVIKYNPEGNQQWVKRYRGSGSGIHEIKDLLIDKNENVYALAMGSVSNVGTERDIGTVKYNSSVDTIWTINYSNLFDIMEWPSSMDSYDFTRLHIAGMTESYPFSPMDFLTLSYNIDGNLRWAQTWNGPGNKWDAAADIASDKNGNVYVTGFATMDSTFDEDIVTIKYDSEGNEKWVRFYDGDPSLPSNDQGYFIKTDLFGNVIVAGGEKGKGTAVNFCTIKYDSLGNQLWHRTYNGPANGSDYVQGLAVDRFGSVYVTGTANETANLYKTITIKYDKEGNQIWLQKYPDGDTISGAKQIILDKNLNVYIAGTISVASPGGATKDIIILKYSQPTSVIPISNEVPDGYKLYQNYPNPFNARTKIGFRVQGSGFTSLKVYDIFGRETAVLLNQKLEPGTHEVEWKAEGLASGLYYYRMISGKYIETKKALLIK